ncbi:AfsR/SARP family transcriptional regulator [Crossiella cryophila]|uniref:DNA-binding SARP family transcriptional activator/tetratricopeptide (TPR) repeat protein n=1 Tax=Crossiella cryophila TaxID=43355 RepID=A0A7W7CEA0_9PSEU|nr:BTAD domain-containing putative transcriptional regulator [Crossiella cryophila]MBB4678213.1 DNA-binding SARP family transcriptional activator/tetratricopeptide (TPR) repeat protein [Crossiella cryophila]
MPVRFRLLGEFQVLDGGAPVEIRHQRQRCVLAALLVDLNKVVRLDTLADRVWGEDLPGRPRDTIYSYVSRLRTTLAGVDEVTVTRRSGGYLLTADPEAVDLHRFHGLLAAAAQDEQRPADLLTQALAQWTGVAFAGLDGAWATHLRETLDRQRFTARLDLADLQLHSGQCGGLGIELSALTAAHPLDERLAGQLMLALYRDGRQGDALREYERIRRLLATELGADLGPALRRLHQQILTSDTAIGPPPEHDRARAHPVPRQLPATPPHFVGREQELALLSRARPDGSPQSTVAIGGAGGIGKTCLALHWAHRNAHRFPDGQLYVDLGGFAPSADPMSAAAAIRRFLNALGVAPAVIPVELDAMAALYRSVIADKRLLIVLDNAADTTQVVPLLPGQPTCAVLITSRRRLIGLTTAHGAIQVDLTVLAEEQARGLLRRRLGAERLLAEPEAVTSILRYCSGLPLALGVVAARAAATPTLPLSMLAEELASTAARLDAFDTDDPIRNLRAVFSWSYRALPTEAGQVFARLGLAPGADFGLTAISCLTALPIERLRVLMRALEGGFLLDQPLPDRYRMHDLLRLYATELAEGIGEAGRHAALRRLVDMYLVVLGRTRSLVMSSPRLHEVVDIAAGDPHWPEFAGSTEALDWLEAERGNLIALVTRLAELGWHDDIWRLAWLLHGFFRARQYKSDWIEVGRLGATAADRIGDRVARFHATNCLGSAYQAAGRWAEAIARYQEVLAASQAADDPERTSIMLNNIGITLVNSGDAGAAVGYLEQALALACQTGSIKDEALCSLNLGDAYNVVGRYPEGLRHNQTARMLFRSLGENLHGAIAAVNIAQSYFGLAELAKAADSAERAGTEFRALGAQYDLAKSLLMLGRVRNSLGQTGLATQAWTAALDTFRKLNDPRAREVEQLLRESA